MMIHICSFHRISLEAIKEDLWYKASVTVVVDTKTYWPVEWWEVGQILGGN